MTHYGPSDIDALNFGVLVLRVSIGFIVASHGYNKFFGGGKIQGRTNWFARIGPWNYSMDYALGIDYLLNGVTGMALVIVLGIGGAAAQLKLCYRPAGA